MRRAADLSRRVAEHQAKRRGIIRYESRNAREEPAVTDQESLNTS